MPQLYIKKKKRDTTICFIIYAILVMIFFSILPWNIFSGLIIVIVIIAIIGIIIIIALAHYSRADFDARQRDAFERVRLGLDKEIKVQIYGMIKAHMQIDLNEACQILDIDKKVLTGMIYEILKEGKVQGEFVGKKIFKVTSVVDGFISTLNTKFANWDAKVESKEGKLDGDGTANNDNAFASWDAKEKNKDGKI